MHSKYLSELKAIYSEMQEFDNNKIPLCAAETYVSDFVKQGLSSIFEGKYIQGYKQRDISSDNIGSEKILPIMNLVESICRNIYGATYVDARTLTGMNCLAILIAAIVDKSKPVIITEKSMGGHASLPSVLSQLGISYIGMPYDFTKNQIDYIALNDMLHSGEYGFVIFCQSDIIKEPNYASINIPPDVGVIYDASQTLGLIGAGLLDNPLDHFANSLLIGGTHKTLPGPTCGLIMTNNSNYINQIDRVISPTLLRNIQPNNIFSLCLALIEQLRFGVDYQTNIINTANKLGAFLEHVGINLIKASDSKYTETHQLFLCCSDAELERVFKRAIKYNITLNKKNMKLFTGIRLGVQEISRYKYSDYDLNKVAELFSLLYLEYENETKIKSICDYLAQKKTPYYILDDIFV